MLAQKLNMDDDAAELWIVKLIRSAKLHAKIDSKAGTVIMGTQHLGIYEQIIDKTRQLSLRSYELVDLFTGECHSEGMCHIWRRRYKNGTIPHKGMTAFRPFLTSKHIIPEWDNYSRPADQLVPIASSCPPAGSNLEWPCRAS